MSVVFFFQNKLKIFPRRLKMHIWATDARRASDIRYPNNGLISVSASSTEWKRVAEVGGVKEESGALGGGEQEAGNM